MIFTLNLFGKVVGFSLSDLLLLFIACMICYSWLRREDPLDWFLDATSFERNRITLAGGDIERISVARKFRGFIIEIRTAKELYHCHYPVPTHLEVDKAVAVLAIAKEIASAERVVLTVSDRSFDAVAGCKRATIEKIELSLETSPRQNTQIASARQSTVIVA